MEGKALDKAGGDLLEEVALGFFVSDSRRLSHAASYMLGKSSTPECIPCFGSGI